MRGVFRAASSMTFFTSTPREQNIPLGIALMFGSVFTFSVNDVLGKWLAGSYPALQILLFRSFASALLLTPIILRVGWRTLFNLERPGLQLIRAILASVEVILFYWSVHYLPLADAMTYYLAGPIYVTVMAAVVLREGIGWRRWTAVIVGFIGVLIALGPSAASFGWPALIAFSGSVIYSVYLVITRVLRRTPDYVMATWQVTTSLIIGIVGAPLAWTPLAHPSDGFLLALLGVASLAAIIGLNRSLSLAPASVVVPYQYMMIVWAVIFGYFVFGNVPSVQMLIGAAIIIGAGLFIFFREQTVGLDPREELAPER
jgi:drug/metabolite transporter (DMT)-like permease